VSSSRDTRYRAPPGLEQERDVRRFNRLATAAVASAAMLGAATAPSFASSHREAPLIAGEPQLDNTDLYAFVSPDKPDSVTIIANWVPIQEPTGGPNFYPFSNNAKYNVHIDNNHDAKVDLTYQWRFKSSYRDPSSFLYNTGPVSSLNDATLNFQQTYTLTRTDMTKNPPETQTLLTDAKVAPSHVGKASMPNYQALRNEAIATYGDGAKSFAGQADDPFFLDLRVFDLLYGTDLKEAGNDTLDNYNVNAIALQVPKNDLALGANAGTNPIVGIYTDTEAPAVTTRNPDGTQAVSENFVHVSRLGNPLVNEVVIDLARKDRFNASVPANDGEYLERVTKPLVPKLIEAIYKIKAPAEPRNDLVSVFLTGVEGLNKPTNGTPSELLRLNMSIAPTENPKRLGVLEKDTAGFPNGRRLTDDVVDIGLQVLMGELVGTPNDLGDGVDANDVKFASAFPYVALPHSGSSTEPRATASGGGTGVSTAAAPGAAPVGGVQTGGGGTAGGVPVLPSALLLGGIAVAGWALVPRRRLAAAAATQAL
jgi:hypothetical protein